MFCIFYMIPIDTWTMEVWVRMAAQGCDGGLDANWGEASRRPHEDIWTSVHQIRFSFTSMDMDMDVDMDM